MRNLTQTWRTALTLMAFLVGPCCAPASTPAASGHPPADRTDSARAPLPSEGQVAAFRIVNDGAATAGRTVSFGQVFRQGAVRPGSRLEVTLAGVKAPAQMNAKALYPDGSVRHAVIALLTPAMGPGAALDGALSNPGGAEPATAAVAAKPPALQVVLTPAEGPHKGRPFRIDLQAIARDPASHREPPWLAGPVLNEQRYYGPSMDGVQIVFDVRTPVAGPSLVDVIVHNDTAQNDDISTRSYALDMTLDGRAAFHLGRLDHYAHSTWHRLIASDGGSTLRVVPDVRLLAEVGAVPRYARINPDPEAMDKLNRLAGASTPLGFGSVTPYMPTTGGRADIGPLPTWAVFYLLHPSRENEQTLLTNADAAGSVPWHVRDLATGGPIDIDKHPDLWLDGRGKAEPPVLARKFYVSDTKWQPDDAHEPSLTYLPYLLTGSQYYRDELAMQAGYVLLSIDPGYRQRDKGLVLGSQIRAVAWDLRTLATAAFILPANSPQQRYFQAKLEGNLQNIIARYVNGHDIDAAGELEGYLPGPYVVEQATPPWQDDYLVMVLGWIDSMGFRDARPIMQWMTNFVAGRFTNAGRGYDPIYGTPYILFVKVPHSDQFIRTWSDAFQTTFDPVHKPVKALDSPDWGGGYAALARGSLASIINSTGSQQAKQAYAFVKKNTPLMDANFVKEPTFAIAPDEPGDQAERP